MYIGGTLGSILWLMWEGISWLSEKFVEERHDNIHCHSIVTKYSVVSIESRQTD